MGGNSNFCTLNPNAQINSGTFSTGLVLFKHTASAWRTSIGTFAVSTGKWYWEACQPADKSGNGFPVGAYDLSDGKFASAQEADYPGQAISTFGTSYSIYSYGSSTRSAYRYNGAETNFQDLGTGAAGDVWQCALDLDNGKIFFGKNNTWDNSANPATGTNPISSTITTTSQGGWTPITCSYSSPGSEVYIQNFGQDSVFGGNKSTGSANAADGNGFGDFYYAPPSGFLALCSNNLPISADIDPAQTSSNYPSKNFNIVKYTGTGTSQAITGLGLQPDLVWIKERGSSGHNVLTDSTRGVTKQIEITDTEDGAQPGESTNTDGVTAFGTDGFTAGGDAEYNGSTKTYVAWCWRAGSGTTATNTSGTINSTVQANTAGGFSIAKYSGTGSNATIGHGLTAAPNFFIIKDLSGNNHFNAYHSSIGATKYLELNTYSGGGTNSNRFQNTAPTSTLISIGTNTTVNGSGNDYIVYSWHNVEGYQRFGTYEGNNTDNNGPFVYLGFRPRLLVLKGIDESYGWYVFDSERSENNLVDDMVSWFPGGSETSEPTGARKVNFLGDGFKVMADAASINGANDTYIYMAWGDVPYKYCRAF